MATSLCNKFEELELIVKDGNFDILFITETWFTEFFSPQLNVYDLYSKCRRDRKGGSVCIFVNQNLRSHEILDTTLNDVDVEQKWCGLKVSGELILLGCLYRPSAHCNAKKLIESIRISNQIMNQSKYTGILLCGDLNCPNIAWNPGAFNYCPIDDQSFEYSLLEALDACFYTQNVMDPTFQVSRHDSKNILDLVITNVLSEFIHINITHGPPLGSLERGHHSLTWNYELKSRKKRDTKFTSSSFNYRKGVL